MCCISAFLDREVSDQYSVLAYRAFQNKPCAILLYSSSLNPVIIARTIMIPL